MIFSAFGNVPTPFIRMAKAIDDLALLLNEEVVVQSGHTRYDFKHATCIPFMSQSDFFKHLNQASVVILQGGWGGISEASDLGCKIIAIPRLKDVEHNHDQIQMVKKLEEMEVLIAVYDISELPKKVNEAKSFNFKHIKRGSAKEIIKSEINKWFYTIKK